MTNMKGNLLARTFAEILFEVGRGRTIWTLILLVHLLLLWRWRRDKIKGWLSLAWLLVFSLGSAISFFNDGLVENAMDGTGYLWAHLYRGWWSTDAAALQGMVERWRSIWLPLYAHWLGIWVAGLLLINYLRMMEQKFRQ